MKKLLVSALTIGVVGVSVIYATNAFFTDTETSTDNTFAAGTLAIEVNENNSSGTFEIGLATITGLVPGDITGAGTITVKNVGSVNAATFGEFTLTGTDGVSLDEVLKFYNYKVEYFNADDTLVDRWTSPDYDPYYGEAVNQDWFIKDGQTSLWTGVGGATILSNWVFGNGVLDVPGTAWDMEALKPGEYYKITFQFQMDPAAGNAYQGENVTLGYVVKATQINTDAIVALGLGGLYNDASYVGPNVTPYLQSQVTP